MAIDRDLLVAESQTVTLPFPPSANTYYRHVEIPLGKGLKPCPVCKRRRSRVATLLSEDGRKWLKDVGRILFEAGVRPVRGRVAVLIVLHGYDRRIFDVDNFSKPVLDALKRRPKDDKQPAWIFADDDSQVDDLHTKRGAIVPGGRCVVTVTKLAQAQGELPMEIET